MAPLVAAAVGTRVSRAQVAAFELTPGERAFTLELARRKTNLWLFRSNQRRFCGDFVVIDMSSAQPAQRSVWVIDLKMNRPLKLGGGGAGVAFRNADAAVGEIATSTGAILPGTALEKVTGDGDVVLAHLMA
jgi:hypothetical protein